MTLLQSCVHLVVIVIVLTSNINFTTSISLQDELTITQGQKVILNKFREMVVNRLPHAYMKEDIYLIKWLRAQDFDLKRAEASLLRNLNWRKEHRMDTIHSENWSDMEDEFPYYIDGFDRQGQPVLTLSIGDWRLRDASLTGRTQRLMRFLDKILDEATVKIREMQKEGKNVTRMVAIISLDNYNLVQHACPACITGFLQFLFSFENYFPGFCDQVILLNVTPVFEIAMQIMKRTLSSESRDMIHVFGKNRQQWEKYVLTYVDKNQLRREYGGTKSS